VSGESARVPDQLRIEPVGDQLLTLGGDAVLVKYTLIGDVGLTGSVGIGAYNAVLNNFGNSGLGWTDGSFDYSGTVGISDYNNMLNNYGSAAYPA